MNAKPRLLWVGHIGETSGLGRVARNLLRFLQDDWAITVMAIDCEIETFTHGCSIFPARFLGDWMGRVRLRKLCQEMPPDLLVLMMDPCYAMAYAATIPAHIPTVAYMPVDAENVLEAEKLNWLAYGIFLSQFGVEQTRRSGYSGDAAVIGHGVDLSQYSPRDQRASRARLGLPRDDFLVGYVGQNQPRKRQDVALQTWALFLQHHPGTRAKLYLHCRPQDVGWDLAQLVRYWRLEASVVFPPNGALVPEADMPYVYSALDVQISTTQGEGFGLTHLEGAACGVPQIVPDFAALAEWPQGAFATVPARGCLVTTGNTQQVCRYPLPEDMATVMGYFYDDAQMRATYAAKGRQLASQEQFRWDRLAAQFQAVCIQALERAISGAPA